MKFLPPLLSGTIIKRYKRFFADIVLDSGETVIAHVPNTGTMKTCYEAGAKVYLSHNPAPHRKLHYTLELSSLISAPESLIGVNTQLTNKLVLEALNAKQLPPFENYQVYQREAPINGGKTKIDFLLKPDFDSDKTLCYLEVKNVTLLHSEAEGIVAFPDAVSTRGQKHLEDLIQLRREGFRSALLFLVQRENAKSFQIAHTIDPKYSELFSKAYEEGVEIYAYKCTLSPYQIEVEKSIPLNHLKIF